MPVHADDGDSDSFLLIQSSWVSNATRFTTPSPSSFSRASSVVVSGGTGSSQSIQKACIPLTVSTECGALSSFLRIQRTAKSTSCLFIKQAFCWITAACYGRCACQALLCAAMSSKRLSAICLQRAASLLFGQHETRFAMVIFRAFKSFRTVAALVGHISTSAWIFLSSRFHKRNGYAGEHGLHGFAACTASFNGKRGGANQSLLIFRRKKNNQKNQQLKKVFGLARRLQKSEREKFRPRP